ncbi:MAG: ATP-binding protein, partial [Clostridia bacterium]
MDIKSRANRIIEQRKIKNKDELKQRREEIFKLFPRIEEIEKNFDATGMKLMRSVAEDGFDAEKAVRQIMLENRLASQEKREILNNGGYPPDYIDEKPLCAVCSDTGYVDGHLCSCVKAELNKELATEANLSEKLSSQTFSGFRFDYYSSVPDESIGISPMDNIKSVYRLCERFAKNFETTDENLFFTGACGLGKTYLSSSIANYLIDKGVDVLYVSANSLFPILEDLHFNRNVSEKNQYLVEHVFDADLLILDDLGAEFVTPFTSAELFRIINSRLINEKKMIISTNMDEYELRKKYHDSDRIYSRIAGNFNIVAFFGEDIR